MPSVIELDDINRDLIDILQTDGRMSYRELGERVGLTPPAVTERIRKLEEAGVIRGYRADVDPDMIGLPLLCIIRLNAPRGGVGVDELIADLPEIIEANRVTGSESHVIRAQVRDAAHLEELLDKLWNYGDSITNIVTSSPVPRRPIRLKALNRPGRR
jgi:Lrp/AsnC family leucine-responsive transcriptional regulator